MAVIRFDANVPVEVALKFDGGKRVQSRIPEAPDQMMYTVRGDDTIYVPLHVADQIAQLGIRKAELFSICKRQQGGVTRWEVKHLSDAAQPTTAAQPEPPSKLEAELAASIPYAKASKAYLDQQQEVVSQRALATPATAQSTQTSGTPNIPNSTLPIAHTVLHRRHAGSGTLCPLERL